jgi:hypothetical protein
MAPTFTLRLTEVQIKERFGISSTTVPRTRWLLESDDPAWTPLNSGQGNVNGLGHDDWAKRWATEQVAENTPYTATAWAHDEATDTWIAELKRISHNFLIAFTDGETCKVRAKNVANAEEIRDGINGGATFIEFINDAEDALFVNLAHVFAITYQPVEVDL